MKIFDFDIKKGIYSFEFNSLDTEIHAHPVVEIINATHGSFSLESNGQTKEDLVFAIIDSNTEHRLIVSSGSVSLLMIESHNITLDNFLKKDGIKMRNGLFVKTDFDSRDKLFSRIKKLALTEDVKTPLDQRVSNSISFIEEHELDYKDLIPTLTSKVFLSSSRLSHLFKEHIGISIKKYLVWNRLKQAMHQYLQHPTSLTEVSLQSGFFDQAHLSNSFRSVLGVNPSQAYNSRTLQF